MKKLKTYSDFLNESVETQLTEAQIDYLNNVCHKGNWKVNSEGKVDVNGNVSMDRTKWEEIPVKFGKITGSFWCQHCNHLKSLEGSPEEVGEHYNCMYCKKLKSFKGSPRKIGGAFEARYCSLVKSLVGAPTEVKKEFLVTGCPIPAAEKEISEDKKLRELWLNSGMSIEEFTQKHRGEIKGKKFNF